jgi:hypothetical protein
MMPRPTTSATDSGTGSRERRLRVQQVEPAPVRVEVGVHGCETLLLGPQVRPVLDVLRSVERIVDDGTGIRG